MAIALIRAAGVAALSLLLPAMPPAQRGPSLEYQVKAQFLQNFLRYIDWPATPADRLAAPHRVCIVGDDPFGVLLDPLAREIVNGRPVVVERVKDEEASSGCKLVFVPKSDEVRLPTIVKVTRALGTLVVAESTRALEGCAAIALVLEGEHVRFHINVAALRHHHLVPSSKLMRVARDVVDYPARCRP